MKILCFGITKEVIGGPSVEVDGTQVNTVAQLRQHLSDVYPALDNYATYTVAVNQTFAAEEEEISESDEIALIPPVSGG